MAESVTSDYGNYVDSQSLFGGGPGAGFGAYNNPTSTSFGSLGANSHWWMPVETPVYTPFDENSFDYSLTIGSQPEYGGFTIGFDEVGSIFDVLDKNLFQDFLTPEDRNFLNNIGVDADGFITDAFGEGAVDALENGDNINPSSNPSIARRRAINERATSLDGQLEALAAARAELEYQEQKRTQDNISNQISKFRGFLTSEAIFDTATGNMVNVGTYHDRELESETALKNAESIFNDTMQDFINSDAYDGRFSVIDENETYIADESYGITPDMSEYGKEFDNPNYGKAIADLGLIEDFRYEINEVTEEDVQNSIDTIDLTFGQNTGETVTPSGYFVAIALDLLGMAGVGTSLYVTQAGYNYVVNGIERVVNKMTGLGFDLPNINLHEVAAEILNQKFIDKDGNPILEGIADKAKYLMPFHNPEATLSLIEMGGPQLGKFDPTGENVFQNIADVLLEGNVLDAVQDQSQAGKFEGIEANRRTGIVGQLDNITAYIQGLGVAGQKIFGPNLSKLIIDQAIFDGYPVSFLLDGISRGLGPNSAKDWVRYLENKGIDPNDVQASDISWWRSTLDDYLESDEYQPSGKTGLNVLLDDTSEGGLPAKYLSSLSNYVKEITGKDMDRMQPAELISVLNDQVQSSIDRNEFNDLLSDDTKLAERLKEVNQTLSAFGEPPYSFNEYKEYLQNELKINNPGQVTFGENNEYYFDSDTVSNLKEAFPEITDAEYEAGFDYLISDGEIGAAFTDGVGFNTTSDVTYFAENYANDDAYVVQLPNVPVTARQFEYRTDSEGQDLIYDNLTGLNFSYDASRLVNNPGTENDLYNFPSITANDLRQSNKLTETSGNANLKKNGRVIKELVQTGKLELSELIKLVNPPEDLTNHIYFSGLDVTSQANRFIQDEVSSYFLQKYAGFTKEDADAWMNEKAFGDNSLERFSYGMYDYYYEQNPETATQEFENYQTMIRDAFGYLPDVQDFLQDEGYVDANFEVALDNTVYLEDLVVQDVYESRPYSLSEPNAGGYRTITDLYYGMQEEFDPDKLDTANNQYFFDEPSIKSLRYKKAELPALSRLDIIRGYGGVGSINPNRNPSFLLDEDSRHSYLKAMIEQGKLTMSEAAEIDKSFFLGTAQYDPEDAAAEIAYIKYGIPPGQPNTTTEGLLAEWAGSTPFAIFNGEVSEFYDLVEPINFDSIVTELTETPFTDTNEVQQFYNFPDFNVIEYDNFNDLNNAYQDRLDTIDASGFDFQTREFLKDSAYNLFESREAFLNLDSTSKQLILQAQEEATSDFIDLGVFTVTANNITDLDTELQTRLNQITAADLSEGQEQYEIDLANAIYNSKLSEINTLTAKNLAITTAENAKEAAEIREGASSQTAADLQARIDKIKTYEIPEFNVIAYLDAEDRSAYMQNFVDEVRKGTTEEFGNFLSIENADQILVNVANLAQSETDLQIVTGERDKYYEDYKKYLEDYNTAISEKTSAEAERDANATRIIQLEGQLYIELENFEVTATDIEGAQNDLDAFNQDIDNRVTNGEITSEQGELEKSLATNSFNVFKATQDIASAQSRIGELETYTLPDFTVEGVVAEDLDTALNSYQQALTQDLNAELINQEQYNALYNSASELVLGQKALNDAEADYSDKEKRLNDKYDALQAEYTDYVLPDMRVTGDNFRNQIQSQEIGYYEEVVDGTEVLRMPDVPVTWEGTDYEYRKSLREQLVSMKREEFYDAEGNSVLTEAQIDDLMDDYRYAVEYWQSKQALLYNSKIKTAQYDTLKTDTDTTIAGLREDVEGLQTFSLPEFSITATTLDGLNDYLDEYLNYVNAAEGNEFISAEQAINFRNIISSLKRNGADIFDLEAANTDKQDEIDTLKTTNQGLIDKIGKKDDEILDLTGTISVIGSGFDVTLYDDISDLDAGLESYIQGINDSDLDEEMKASQIAFAESMAEMRRENLYVPTYEAPDFNVIAEGDLTGLNTSYEQAMFTLDSFLGNEYITQEEYDANVSALNESYNTRKETLVPAYTLPEFTVSELDAEGGFTNLDSEKQSFIDELQGFLDSDYITREEYDSFEAQIESAYDTKKRDITPVYEAPDFTVYGQLEPGGTFEDIDTAYNTAFDELTLNARQGYISASDYITQLNDLQTSYEDARKGIAPTYELPDFSVYGDLQEGDDFTEIDTAYQNELTRLEEYKDSGYISLSDYYGFLGDLETEYTARRKGILPTYTMPDFGVTPASSLAELAEMEQAARDRFTMFSDQEYFPEDFDILTEQGNLESLFDAERARLQGTYTLPEFAVEDTKGLLRQEDISNLFSEYEEGLQEDVVSGMLGITDFFSAMEGARGIFDFEFGRRKPIQPREGGYAIVPDPINEDETDESSQGDFLDYVDDGNYADQYGTIGGGVDTSGILTGNYMAKLDPAYQLAEMLLGEAGARDLFPTGKSRGLADAEFQEVVNEFMLGQADDAFDMQAGLAGKQQDLTDQLTRLKRQSDLDLMAEFGDPYRKQIEELYPGATEALQAQQEIARRSADQARGDLSPAEQSRLEQSSAIFGAQRGRDFDPITLANRIGEESQFRQQRDAQASNQQIAAMNAEKGLYGDLMSTIGTDSPYAQGVGNVTTPFNIGGIMDLGTVDYANQQRLQEAQMAVSSLQRDYDTAVALREPSRAQRILNDLNKAKQTVDNISMGLSTAQQAFGTVKDIFGGITSLFGGGRSGINTNSFNMNASNSVNYADKDSFERYLYGLGF